MDNEWGPTIGIWKVANYTDNEGGQQGGQLYEYGRWPTIQDNERWPTIGIMKVAN